MQYLIHMEVEPAETVAVARVDAAPGNVEDPWSVKSQDEGENISTEEEGSSSGEDTIAPPTKKKTKTATTTGGKKKPSSSPVLGKNAIKRWSQPTEEEKAELRMEAEVQRVANKEAARIKKNLGAKETRDRKKEEKAQEERIARIGGAAAPGAVTMAEYAAECLEGDEPAGREERGGISIEPVSTRSSSSSSSSSTSGYPSSQQPGEGVVGTKKKQATRRK
jgi:hypothetical protein